MILSRQLLFKITIVIKLYFVIGKHSLHKQVYDINWKHVEALAEEFPYVVALTNFTKDYMCTGVIINKKTVLTSGNCIDPLLYYIAVGNAVINREINVKSLNKIAGFTVHADYSYELKATDPNVTQMHSNIGLVFSVEPSLEAYIPAADLGNYFASELAQQNLRVVGYGKINGTNMAVLQQQIYQQTPCTNPKWYYCVCGFEFTGHSKTYEEQFGEGAPVFLRADVVGLAAAPCGTLGLKHNILKYNIFTVLGPYLPWIDKKHTNITAIFRTASKGSAGKAMFLHSVCTLLVVINVLFY